MVNKLSSVMFTKTQWLRVGLFYRGCLAKTNVMDNGLPNDLETCGFYENWKATDVP